MDNIEREYKQKTEKMFVGYIDLLGMAEKVSKMSKKAFCDFCNEISRIIDDIDEENRNWGTAETRLECHMFSDNLVILSNDLHSLLVRIGLVQRKIILHLDVAVKGCIDYGDIFYYKHRFLLGEGLVYAYDVDKKYHNPAICISKRAMEKVRELEWQDYVRKISYDEYVVDFYAICADYSTDFIPGDISRLKEFIERNLATGYREYIMHKYNFLREFHNEYCQKTHLYDMIIE